MKVTEQIAEHVRGVYFEGNWTVSSLKTHLADVNWQEATTKVHGLNTIAILTFHLNYYVHNVSNFLAGQPFTSKDAAAFTHPPIENEQDWQGMLSQVWEDAEQFAEQIAKLEDDTLLTTFIAEKYGNYFRNLMGIVEHIHYHLGQIVILKKIIRSSQQH